jgi:hypothetical protein
MGDGFGERGSQERDDGGEGSVDGQGECGANGAVMTEALARGGKDEHPGGG